MAVSATTCFGPRAEISILETNQCLRSELEKCKQNFQDLTEKFLTSKATAYSLANHLQKYKCEECKVIESVLEEEVQFQERELAELPRSAARLRSRALDRVDTDTWLLEPLISLKSYIGLTWERGLLTLYCQVAAFCPPRLSAHPAAAAYSPHPAAAAYSPHPAAAAYSPHPASAFSPPRLFDPSPLRILSPRLFARCGFLPPPALRLFAPRRLLHPATFCTPPLFAPRGFLPPRRRGFFPAVAFSPLPPQLFTRRGFLPPPRLGFLPAAALCPPPPRLFAPTPPRLVARPGFLPHRRHSFLDPRRRGFLLLRLSALPPPRLFVPPPPPLLFAPPPPWLFARRGFLPAMAFYPPRLFAPRCHGFLPPRRSDFFPAAPFCPRRRGFLLPRLFAPVAAAFYHRDILPPPPRIFVPAAAALRAGAADSAASSTGVLARAAPRGAPGPALLAQGFLA
ncbi:uncharacterized protein LOC134809772 [Pan troglodytes]|uniref:uncharacterized protein LOC134809772 n=1 Tax=Pan troglodytes TaxID=9598 RepID=UPI0030132318